ncbi:Metallo-dependent phosphatase-like protein [Chlamydoabsidia padenii]|nr:Metallo-dependent phosphatase-like protein [Chlamydoabsidia padenii]
MLKWIYFGMVFLMISLGMTWSIQILSTTPGGGGGNGQDRKHRSRLNNTNYRYFLHITDFHLDAHYLPGATVKSACHKLPDASVPTYNDAITGEFGVSGCDTPTALAQKTVDWIAKEWKDKLDFVIWTGDNARHDWDKNMKRSRTNVYESNQIMTKMIKEAFGNISVVPSLGNNDVIPHNQITQGGQMNKKTDQLLGFYQDLWHQWIPQDQHENFVKYGAFVVNVGPKLRALSLNTMYFIKKNKKVKGCHKPGTARQHMDWFEQQLAQARMDGSRMVVLGHVPPSEENYRSSCLDAYIHISAAYSDLIIGHHYGHLNKDHFLLYDTNRMDSTRSWSANTGNVLEQQQQEMISTRKPKIPKFARLLFDMYTSLNPRHDLLGKEPFEKSPVVAIQVTPSVLPKYFPTVRIYGYTTDDQGAALVRGYEQYFANITEWEQQPDGPHQYQLLYSTDDYGMNDLSSISFFDLAKRMVDPTDRGGYHLWKSYVNNIFIHTRTIF